MDFKKYIPEGVQDYLPMECYNKREVERIFRRRFKSCGYLEVETPMFEHYEVFGNGIGSVRQEKMIKFFDAQGRILSLRPDITMPIARMVATKKLELPSRLCYLGNAFGYDNTVYGEQKEFTQAGVECIGYPGEEADAELIATAILALKDVGLVNFQLDIGQVEFFKGLMEEAGLGYEESKVLLEAVDRKDAIAMELLLRDKPLSEKLKQRIMQLTTLYGGEEVFAVADEFSSHPVCRGAVDYLRKVYEYLKEYGLGEYVSIDFGMLKSIDYYTGIIFRGITDDLGCPLLAGGRYDTLIESFGRDACATGFAIGVKRVLIALERQGNLKELPMLDAVIAGFDRSAVFSVAENLRGEGQTVEQVVCSGSQEMDEQGLIDYARGKAKTAVYVYNAQDYEVFDVEVYGS